MKAIIQIAAGAGVGLVFGGIMLLLSAIFGCNAPPPSTGADAQQLELCVAGDILKGIIDPVQILKDCPGATEKVIGDAVQTLDKNTPALRAKLADAGAQ